MEITFTRVPEVQCEGVVRLDNGRVFQVRNPGAFKQVPPHDVGQLVIELELGWQTGFWGYIARGVVFREMTQIEGKRPPHGEERSRAAIREGKDLLAEVECLAGAIAAIARDNVHADPSRASAMLAKSWWPPHSRAARLPIADIRRACRAYRQAEADWHALAVGDSLRFRWSLRKNPLAPENPLDVATSSRRTQRRAP